MNNDKIDEAAQREAAARRAVQHDATRMFLNGIGSVIVGALIWGFALWLGAIAVHATYPQLLPSVGYWTCVGFIAGLYALRMTLWEGVKRR